MKFVELEMCTGLAVHQCTLYMSSPRNVTHLRPNLSCVSSDRLNDGQIDHCDSHHPVLCYNESLHTGLTRGHQMRSEYPFIFSPIGQIANCKIWLLSSDKDHCVLLCSQYWQPCSVLLMELQFGFNLRRPITGSHLSEGVLSSTTRS